MAKALRLVGIVALWILAGQVLRPCESKALAQTRQDQIFCETQAQNPCDYPQCDYMDLDYCDGMPVLPGETEPSCCGSGVDCRCDWFGGNPAYLDGGDFYCTGYSYCCGHDQCCRDAGWIACVTVCWGFAAAYC